MKHPIICLCMAAALLLAADDTNTKFEQFSPKDGRFSVQMPGKPKEQTNKVPTAAGPIEAHMFTVAPDANTAYILSYSDYPEELVKNSDPQKMLDGARDGAVKNVKGTLESEKKISIDGHPGRDFLVSTARFQIRNRIYMVDNRLYQVMLVGSKDFVAGKDAQKFIESFKLTEK